MLNVNQLAKVRLLCRKRTRVSQDNKILAYAIDTLSRRVYTYKFLNLETGKHLEDEYRYRAWRRLV